MIVSKFHTFFFFRILHWNYVNATQPLCPSTTSWNCIRSMDVKVNVWIFTYPISRSDCFCPSRGVEEKGAYGFRRCFQNVCFNCKVAQSDSVRNLISDYYHPCLYWRREASEFVWWYYHVTAWTAEESAASLNSLFGTVRKRSSLSDRHMLRKKWIRFCYDVTPVRQCNPKSTYDLFLFIIPSQSSFLGSQGRVFVTDCAFLWCFSSWFFFVCCCFDLPTLYLFLLSHEMNIIPAIVDSVMSLTSAKRAWMFIAWELILRGRSTP